MTESFLKRRSSQTFAVVLLSPVMRADKPALLRIPHPIELRPDTRVRVLDASVAVDAENDDQPAIVTLGMFSEMFAVPTA